MSHQASAPLESVSLVGGDAPCGISLNRFPALPNGVTIIPFKDYKEVGIQRSQGPDGIERDHLGIPTIQLCIKHATDVPKTIPDAGTPIVREVNRGFEFKKEWWEDWQESEDLRIHGPYHRNLPAVLRFRRAAEDFQKYRKFPKEVFKLLWQNTFVIYAGILGTTPVWKTAAPAKPEDGGDADVSDDDFADSNIDEFRKSTRPREPYELYPAPRPTAETPQEIDALFVAAHAKRDARAERFLADPAKAIQIYLSSYMFEENLMIRERNLVDAPHLLRFFTKFLLRNRVLPEKVCEDGLRHALYIIDLATTELPLTSKISKALPDTFSTACQNFWGLQRRVDTSPYTPDSLDEEDIEISVAEDDVVDMDGDVDYLSWDADSSSPTNWELSSAKTPTLLTLHGPTTLPLTHAPGVVERSLRRIASIRGPALDDNSPPPPAADAVSGAAAVERGLKSSMFSVDLAAWPDWDPSGSSGYAVPEILQMATLPPSASGSDFAPCTRTPHTADDMITLLVDPAAAEHLLLGMGLAGKWVQLVRLDLKGNDSGTQPVPVPRHREFPATDDIWYLEELMAVIPSYWIPR
ncbi:hypothetical protein B0H11DRAFT_1356399 [Mycena galericulata]|nr:hypothetical protein B0H11DRAFT_1356399 [Mycena galericulata]